MVDPSFLVCLPGRVSPHDLPMDLRHFPRAPWRRLARALRERVPGPPQAALPGLAEGAVALLQPRRVAQSHPETHRWHRWQHRWQWRWLKISGAANMGKIGENAGLSRFLAVKRWKCVDLQLQM